MGWNFAERNTFCHLHIQENEQSERLKYPKIFITSDFKYLTRDWQRKRNINQHLKREIFSISYFCCLFLSLLFRFSIWECNIFFSRIHSISATLNGDCSFISLFCLITSGFFLIVFCCQQTKSHLLQISHRASPAFQKSLLLSAICHLLFWPSSFELLHRTTPFLVHHTTYFFRKTILMWFYQPALIFNSASRFLIKCTKL